MENKTYNTFNSKGFAKYGSNKTTKSITEFYKDKYSQHNECLVLINWGMESIRQGVRGCNYSVLVAYGDF